MATARTTHRLYGATRPNLAEARSWVGSRVTDSLGSGLGRLEDVWVDADTGDPDWLLIREGRFGSGKHRLVPFEGATAGRRPALASLRARPRPLLARDRQLRDPHAAA